MAPQHDLTRYSVVAAFAEELNGGLAFICCRGLAEPAHLIKPAACCAEPGNRETPMLTVTEKSDLPINTYAGGRCGESKGGDQN
jgi:hypothetical protein